MHKLMIIRCESAKLKEIEHEADVISTHKNIWKNA